MKINAKYTALTLTAICAALYVFEPAPARVHIPSDLRDAVGDGGFDTSIPDVRRSGSAVPEANGPRMQNVAIIGKNTLTDYYKVNSTLQQMADSTAAFIEKASLAYDANTGRYKVVGLGRLDKNSFYAKNSPFYGQATLAFCSGSLVARNMILTAGHCLSRDPASTDHYSKFYVVFGWKSESRNSVPDSFPAEDVFEVASAPVWTLDNLGGTENKRDNYKDYALLVLNRDATPRKPLALDRSGLLVAKGRNVFTIGYTLGMPVKITDPGDAVIREVGERMFGTTLDSFGGNSGGPVFDSSTRRIIGIHVTGDARSKEIRLKRDLVARFRVIEGADFSMSKVTTRGRDGSETTELEITRLYYDALKRRSSGCFFDEQSGMLFISKKEKLYSNYPEYEIMMALDFQDYQMRAAQFKEKDAVLASEERLPPGLEQFIPLNDEEQAVCNELGRRMNNRGVINPDVMMLYKAAHCGRTVSI